MLLRTHKFCPLHFDKIQSSAVPPAPTQAYPVPCLPGAIDPRPVDFDLIIQQARERIKKPAGTGSYFEDKHPLTVASNTLVGQVQHQSVGYRKGAESLKRCLKARREEQLDKWPGKSEEEVEEIENGSQQIVDRASEVGGGP